MEKNFLGQEEMIGENGNSIELNYYLLKNAKFFEEMNEENMTYGIEIVKKELGEIEDCKIEDITTDKERIGEIIDIIKRNNVTPIHLNEIVSDLL